MYETCTIDVSATVKQSFNIEKYWKSSAVECENIVCVNQALGFIFKICSNSVKSPIMHKHDL